MKGTPIDIYVIPKDVKLTGVINKNGTIETVDDNGLYHSTMVAIPDGTNTVTTVRNQKFSNPDIMTIMQEDERPILSKDCIGIRFSYDREYKKDRITIIKDREKNNVLCIIYSREYDIDDSDTPFVNKKRCAAYVMRRLDKSDNIINTHFSTLLQWADEYKYAAVFKERRKNPNKIIVSRTTSEECDIYLYDGNNKLLYKKGIIITNEASRNTYLELYDNQ